MTKMYEAADHLLICTGYADPAEHSHMAAQLVVSLDGRIQAGVGDERFLCRGIWIPPGVSHAVQTGGNSVLVFLYDCTTEAARKIRTVRCMPEAFCEQMAAAYRSLTQEETPDRYALLEDCLRKQLGITGRSGCVTDARIRAAMAYIRSRCRENLTCREAARFVHLSQSRFSHLFREQVGMTFASYLIYQRLMYGYGEILRGKSVTEAAMTAGFSSSGHFADVNRRVFGISASAITRDLLFSRRI